MTPPDQFAALLLLLLGVVLALCLAAVLFVRRMTTKRQAMRALEEIPDSFYNQPGFAEPTGFHELPFNHPKTWLAIRNRNTAKVQEALGLRDTRPCSWEDGLNNAESCGIFVSPPIGGWTLAIGPSLPGPDHDIDSLFRFITSLSARLSHVQYFHADSALCRHAWAKSEYGRILRGFAWTDQTIWNQGKPTPAEVGLGMICPGYSEDIDSHDGFGQPDFAMANVERVSALAARWSVDLGAVNPKALDRNHGVTGKPRLPELS